MNHNDSSGRMYREHILELYKKPQNYGILKNATHSHEEHNTFCGDEIKMQLIVKNNKLMDARFSGSGCVISMVSASLLTSMVKGMNVPEIKKLGRKDMLKAISIDVNPARMKCVLLPLEAAKKALGTKND